MTTRRFLYVSAFVSSDDQDVIARAVEVFARSASGLALEYIPVTLEIRTDESDDDGADDD